MHYQVISAADPYDCWFISIDSEYKHIAAQNMFFRTFGARTQTLFNAFIHFIRLTGLRVCHNRLVVLYFPQSPPKTSKLLLRRTPKTNYFLSSLVRKDQWHYCCVTRSSLLQAFWVGSKFGFPLLSSNRIKGREIIGHRSVKNAFWAFCFRILFLPNPENRKLFGIYYQYDLHIFTYHPLCHPATFEHHNIININININIIIIIIIIIFFIIIITQPHPLHHHKPSQKQKTSTKYREQHHKNLNRTSTKSKRKTTTWPLSSTTKNVFKSMVVRFHLWILNLEPKKLNIENYILLIVEWCVKTQNADPWQIQREMNTKQPTPIFFAPLLRSSWRWWQSWKCTTYLCITYS